MPRPRTPATRSDGQNTQGNLGTVGDGQPNGRPPRSAITQEQARAGTGAPMSYGEGGALASAAASTPAPVLPPGVTPDADAARQALAAHMKANPVTPLFAPTQRPMEPVTAGAPLDPGPTNPMALPQGDTSNTSIAATLQQAAASTGNPALARLAAQAQAIATPGQ